MMDRLDRLGTAARAPIALTLLGASAVSMVAAMLGLLDPVALLITLGGALAVTRATFSGGAMQDAWSRLLEALSVEDSEEDRLEDLIVRFKRFARIHRVEGAPALDQVAERERDSFVRRAVQHSLACADADEVRESLSGEARVRASEGERARRVLLTLGRLLPAFGLIGTLIGLVMVLRSLGGDQGLPEVAPALGLTVLTTLYGAVLANVVVLPLAAKLHAHLMHENVQMQMIIHGAELLHEREYPTRIERALRSHAGLPGMQEPIPLTVLHERAA